MRILASVSAVCMWLMVLACSDTGAQAVLQDTGGTSPLDLVASDGSGEPEEDGLEETTPDSTTPVKPVDLPDYFVGQEVDWFECVLDDATGEGLAECAFVDAPLWWSEPNSGEAIQLKLKRYNIQDGATRQLWVLQGGMGTAGTTTLGPLMENLAEEFPTTEFYTVDQRGTGGSTQMECPEAQAETSDYGWTITEDEWPGCIEYLQSEWYPLDAFTFTASAKDLGLVIEMNRREDVDRFVYGISNATYWIQRYGVLFPEQPTGLILDSVSPAQPGPAGERDLVEASVSQRILELCGADSVCASKMGNDPQAKALETLQKLKQGHCPGLQQYAWFYASYFQYLVHQFAMGYDVGRAFLPALYYRIDRCEPADVSAIYNAISTVFGATQSSYYSLQTWIALGRHMMASELVQFDPDGPTQEEIASYQQGLVSTRFASTSWYDYIQDWPAYPLDEYFGRWIPESVPVLMLQGTLDYVNPLEWADHANTAMNGPHQYFVMLPNIRYASLYSALFQDEESPAGLECPLEILARFLESPETTPDTECTDEMPGLDFAGNEETNLAILGTPDLWENPASEPVCELPEGFLTHDAPSHLVLTYQGSISEGESDNVKLGTGTIELSIDGAPAVDSPWQLYALRYKSINYDGLLVQGYGNQLTHSETHTEYDFIRITISSSKLDYLLDTGTQELIGGLYPPGYNVLLAHIEAKVVNGETLTKMCNTGIIKPQSDSSKLRICTELNETFDAGEMLGLATHTELLTDPDQFPDQMGPVCSCWKGEQVALDCAEF